MHKSWQLLLYVRAHPRLETTLLEYFPSVALFALTDHYDDDLYIYIVNRKILPAWEEKV